MSYEETLLLCSRVDWNRFVNVEPTDRRNGSDYGTVQLLRHKDKADAMVLEDFVVQMTYSFLGSHAC